MRFLTVTSVFYLIYFFLQDTILHLIRDYWKRFTRQDDEYFKTRFLYPRRDSLSVLIKARNGPASFRAREALRDIIRCAFQFTRVARKSEIDAHCRLRLIDHPRPYLEWEDGTL